MKHRVGSTEEEDVWLNPVGKCLVTFGARFSTVRRAPARSTEWKD